MENKWMLEVRHEANYLVVVDGVCPNCGRRHEKVFSGYFPGFDRKTAEQVAERYARQRRFPNFCDECGKDMR